MRSPRAFAPRLARTRMSVRARRPDSMTASRRALTKFGLKKSAGSAGRPWRRRSPALGLPAVLDLEADQPRQQCCGKQLPDHRLEIGKVARNRIERVNVAVTDGDIYPLYP